MGDCRECGVATEKSCAGCGVYYCRYYEFNDCPCGDLYCDLCWESQKVILCLKCILSTCMGCDRIWPGGSEADYICYLCCDPACRECGAVHECEYCRTPIIVCRTHSTPESGWSCYKRIGSCEKCGSCLFADECERCSGPSITG